MMAADGSARLRLLAIASRPSDYVEMADLARALDGRGHEIALLYLYSRDDPSSARVIEQMNALTNDTAVTGAAVEVTELPAMFPELRSQPDGTSPPVSAAADQASRPGAARPADEAATNALRSVALWARRRGLNIYPKNTIVGRAAYGATRVIDALRDRERLAEARRLLSNVRRRLRELPFWWRFEAVFRIHQAAATVLYYRRYAAFFADSIAQRQFHALLIPEDIVGNVWPVAIRAGHEAGIPTLVLPYTLANREEAIQSLKDAVHYQTRPNRVAAAWYPKWRFRNDGIDIVRLPSGHIFAHEDLDIAPPDPWMMNSGYSDRILVDSRASFEYFRAGDIPAEQMAIVGSVSQDRMFELRRNRDGALQSLRAELGVMDTRPLLLISGCPNQLSGPVPFCEFTSIEDLARFVGECVAPLAAHYHLVVRPHPNFIEFGDMLQPFAVRTTMAPTASLVPLADLFVAFASATIRWAIACAIPTVNYDVFHYGYGDFAAARGVASVSGSAEFRELARSLAPGAPRLTSLAEHARADSAKWSMMDGRSLARIAREIVLARARRGRPAKEPVLTACSGGCDYWRGRHGPRAREGICVAASSHRRWRDEPHACQG